jgi:hypothetical protein
MNSIQIENLWPGEEKLSRRIIDRYTSQLQTGEDLEPITVGRLGEKQFVRDGNHRVRALVEFANETKQPMPPLTFEDSSRPITSIAQTKFEEIFGRFGKGPKAFLKIPFA